MDHFFYANMMTLRKEIMDDIETSLLVGDRSIPYFREYGAGLSTYENEPVSFSTLIKMRYDVASWLAKRNIYVSDGNDDKPDRRAVTSQTLIKIEQMEDHIDVVIPILTMFDMEVSNMKVSVGGK